MGAGDEMMAAGEVRQRAAGPGRFAIIDPRPGKLRHRWHEMWQANPRIAMPGQAYEHEYANAPGVRPYIAGKTSRQWLWRPYAPTPAELFLTPQELSLSAHVRRGIVIQPQLKASASPNKQWGWDRWQALVDLAPSLNWMQLGADRGIALRGVTFVETRTFREACGALTGAAAAVLNEGGLHHAAAAQGIPAVVIFGGFISPMVTGYKDQRSLFVPHETYPLGCGMRTACGHCELAMRRITPGDVLRELNIILYKGN